MFLSVPQFLLLLLLLLLSVADGKPDIHDVADIDSEWFYVLLLQEVVEEKNSAVGNRYDGDDGCKQCIIVCSCVNSKLLCYNCYCCLCYFNTLNMVIMIAVVV